MAGLLSRRHKPADKSALGAHLVAEVDDLAHGADVVVAFEHLGRETLADVAQLIETNDRFDYVCWDVYSKMAQYYADHAEALEWRKETLHRIEAGEGDTAKLGKMIARAVAGTDKKVTLELGGKAANIVFDDAPLDQAVEGIVNGIYFNQGHVCCAGSRLFVQESIYETIISKLKRRMSTLRVGDPLDKNTDIGAINSRQQLDKITELVESGKEEGADIYQPPCRLPEKGYWFVPTVFTACASKPLVLYP